MILQISNPAHDFNDFEFKERHNHESNIIESINNFTNDGKIDNNGDSRVCKNATI